jgi:anti-sigma-K factor RskA
VSGTTDNLTSDTEQPDDLLELYVLGVLDDDEVATVERRLRDDPVARERVRELRGVTAFLAADVEPLDPPPALRDRILSAARVDVQQRDPEPVSTPAPPPVAAPAPPAPVSLSAERERRAGVTRITFPWAIAAVLAVALVGSMFWNASLRRDLDDRDQAIAQAHSIIATGFASGASGRVLIVDDEGTAWLALSGLPLPEPGQVFQVWLIAGGAPVPNVTFTPNTLGYASVAVPVDVPDYRVIAITVEPEGGSPAPTTDPVIISDLGEPVTS